MFDRKKFGEIYDQYVRLVAFVVSKYLSDEEDIKDLTNEVFVRFFERAAVETIGNVRGLSDRVGKKRRDQ